ncbi:ATP citrate synthase [Candidatus Gracilibacteria bacterium 28_42_T64]|nr:ATP citrate synthase [Candidatus Gracilibacteria bacterium 28_42_T64]
MFSRNSFAIIYGLQTQAAQKMLDFDYLCEREASVLAFINAGKQKINHKLFYGDTEILIPSYPNIISLPEQIKQKTDTLVNFASFRSAAQATNEALESKIFKNVIIIAEGIPERQTIEIIEKNKQYGVNIIGPATVGAMSAGEFRVGNTGGSLDNIVSSKLYQKGSIGLVSKSGGMSNEMRRIIADRTNGTSISIALGGDKYNIMTFTDVMKNFEADDEVKMIVMLGEIGGREENKIADMITAGEIKKPVVAWCIGTIGDTLKGDVQFGHAGAKSNANEETANYKNNKLKKAGAHVPESFIDFGDKIEEAYHQVNPGFPKEEGARGGSYNISEKIKIMNNRKSTQFTSTISDERGAELTYNKRPISEYAQKGSFADVIGNLWLKKDLPEYALDFINTTLILLADHGPAVSGATNAIITARAGNDLKSSLIAGLTTIGPKFGGAIDGAANYFSQAVHDKITPEKFVESMREAEINIPGIGHKVKSKFNPDKRCEILLNLSKKFPQAQHLQFALEVEKLTLEKKSNLILNVDGMVAAMFLDIFQDIGMDYEEIKEYIDIGIFNAFFILARTTGFIGHIIDQKRSKEGLYRTPWEDIMYD